MVPFALIVPFLVASLQPTLSAAFSWHLTTTPTQCSNLSISIVGSDGQPPYRVLVLPTGPTPLANNVDVRPIIDQAFDGNSTSASFPINYPANSRFIAVVSDANGFGTGGASVETLVADSNDASCFDSTKTWPQPFYYGIGGDNQLTQCQPTRVWWNATNAQGTASFVGVVPGGQCFELPESNISIVQDQGPGFAWTPDIRGGTTVIIVGGDNRGMGTAGCTQFTVHPASDATCLDNLSPSSTPGVAAGTLQTDAVASGTSSAANDGGPNVGVIVGAAVGGIIGLMALITFIVLSYYCLRQDGRRTRRLQRHVPTTSSVGHLSSSASRPLSGHTHQGTSIATAPDEQLAHYRPEPFTFAGVGTYNNEYPYGGQGYGGGMASGSMAPPRTRLDSVASGSGAGMSDTSSHVGSRPYGGQGYVGGMAPGTASAVPPRSRLDSVTSGSGAVMSDTSSHAGSRYGWSPSQGPNPGLQQTSGLPSMKSGSGLYDASSQMGSKHGASLVLDTSGYQYRRSPPQGANPGLQQTSGLPSMKSGSGLYDASSQMGSKHGAPSVISNTPGPSHTRGGTIAFPYENTVPREPPPAFTPSNTGQNPPTGDVKYKITNPG